MSGPSATMGSMTAPATHSAPVALPVMHTQAGQWPPMMVDLATRLAADGHTLACSPDPSGRANQSLVLVQYADGTVGTLTTDPTGANPFYSRGLCNYDHHDDAHRANILDGLLESIEHLGGADVAALLGDYRQFWQGHHLPAAALTLWWDARMAEGHTVEHAQFLLSLIAHPDVLSRVMLSEHEGRTRAWLDHYPTGHPQAYPSRRLHAES